MKSCPSSWTTTVLKIIITAITSQQQNLRMSNAEGLIMYCWATGNWLKATRQRRLMQRSECVKYSLSTSGDLRIVNAPFPVGFKLWFCISSRFEIQCQFLVCWYRWREPTFRFASVYLVTVSAKSFTTSFQGTDTRSCPDQPLLPAEGCQARVLQWLVINKHCHLMAEPWYCTFSLPRASRQ